MLGRFVRAIRNTVVYLWNNKETVLTVVVGALSYKEHLDNSFSHARVESELGERIGSRADIHKFYNVHCTEGVEPGTASTYFFLQTFDRSDFRRQALATNVLGRKGDKLYLPEIFDDEGEVECMLRNRAEGRFNARKFECAGWDKREPYMEGRTLAVELYESGSKIGNLNTRLESIPAGDPEASKIRDDIRHVQARQVEIDKLIGAGVIKRRDGIKDRLRTRIEELRAQRTGKGSGANSPSAANRREFYIMDAADYLGYRKMRSYGTDVSVTQNPKSNYGEELASLRQYIEEMEENEEIALCVMQPKWHVRQR